MAQVFRTTCRITLTETGVGGVLRLWPPTLWDWAWTAARERLSSLFHGRYAMRDTTALDRQFSDTVWLIVGGLRSGYSLPQTFEVLATDAPEPTRRIFQRIVDALQDEQPIEKVLDAAHQQWPSPHLKRIIQTILNHRKTGGNLATQIDALYGEIREQAGSDEAMYPAMREQAYQLGRPLPDYARPKTTWDTPPPLPDAENTTVYDVDGTPVATADYVYHDARIFVLVAGETRWQTWIKTAPGRLGELGYRPLVVSRHLAEAGIHEVAAYVREAFPDILA
jgi:hypothetical protein